MSMTKGKIPMEPTSTLTPSIRMDPIDPYVRKVKGYLYVGQGHAIVRNFYGP